MLYVAKQVQSLKSQIEAIQDGKGYSIQLPFNPVNFISNAFSTIQVKIS